MGAAAGKLSGDITKRNIGGAQSDLAGYKAALVKYAGAINQLGAKGREVRRILSRATGFAVGAVLLVYNRSLHIDNGGPTCDARSGEGRLAGWRAPSIGEREK